MTHLDIVVGTLLQAEAFAAHVAERTTDDTLRREAQTLGPQLASLRDALRDGGAVKLPHDGLQRLGANIEAVLDAMRRQHPELRCCRCQARACVDDPVWNGSRVGIGLCGCSATIPRIRIPGDY